MSYRVDYIGATWCKVCHTVLPEIQKLLNLYDISLKTYDVDVDKIEDVSKVPTVRLYKDDVLMKTITTEHVKTLRTELALTQSVKLDADF
jgi:thiol-disulfide isomerase/thioredoxin